MRKHFTLYSSTSVHLPGKSDSRSDSRSFKKRKSERYNVSPGELIIRNILNYSLALSVLPTKDPGLNSMLMN
jgi:hypothetical protein